MARIKNASFFGMSPRSVTKDSSIFSRWLRNVAGDAALVGDISTGENGETPANHSGGGLGCPLMLPLASQHINASLALAGAATEEDYYILAVPVFIAAGESTQYRLTVSVTRFGGDGVFAEVRDSSWAVNFGPAPGARNSPAVRTVGREDSPGESVVTWLITLGPGIQWLLVKRPCYLDDTDAGARLFWWTLDHDRSLAGESNGIRVEGEANVGLGDYYLTNSSTYTPATMHDTYDEEVQDDGPLNSYALTRINREINALWERITGGKVPGNNDYRTSTTLNNNRASFTAEGLIEFPITVIATGGAPAAGGKPTATPAAAPTAGMTGWVRQPTTQTGTLETALVRVWLPRFRTGSSDFDAEVLFFLPSPPATTWQARIATDAGNSGWASLTQIGSSDWYRAQVTAIPFTAAGEQFVIVQVQNLSGGALADVVALTGLCAYFNP